MDIQGNERDITDRESERDVSRLPGASQSGVSIEEASLPGSGAPGTRLPRASCDRAQVESLMRQLRMEKLLRRRAERALVKEKRINLALRKKHNLINQKFKKIFNTDQIRALGHSKKGGIQWGKESIKKAIGIRFCCGTTGYKTLQAMNMPLPDIRTIQRRMQHVKLEPGVLGEVFDMLRLKTDGMNEMEKKCVLTLDEMSITPSVELHLGSGRLFGDLATKARPLMP